jgi:NADPH:quinone reductase-like Zn-dependent oxidoreductase
VPGDRVIGNNAYPQSGVPGLPAGVPTNHASHEFLVLHRAKLARIPEGMPDSVAASFSIAAAQTSYSMIWRLDLPRGASVLVAAAKSNTSLFAIAALAGRGFDLYALSTSDRFAEELHRPGVEELFVADPSRGPLAADPAIASAAARIGGSETAAFLERSYNARDRFGKVVYAYD